MKIAVPYADGQIFGHFGQTQTFKIYETDGSQVVSTQTLAADGYAHCALANLLAKENVDALICGGIGGGALAKLNAAGIKFYAGVSGDADAAVAALLAGEEIGATGPTCGGHSHDHAHGGGCGCGGHGHEHSHGGGCGCGGH